jgi:hypothetical protein
VLTIHLSLPFYKIVHSILLLPSLILLKLFVGVHLITIVSLITRLSVGTLPWLFAYSHLFLFVFGVYVSLHFCKLTNPNVVACALLYFSDCTGSLFLFES